MYVSAVRMYFYKCSKYCALWPSEAMRTTDFDSSSEDEEVGEEQLTPLHISW